METHINLLQCNFNYNFERIVVLGFNVPPTAKDICRRDLSLKSHPKDWRSPGSNSRPLVYKASTLTTTPQRLLKLGGVLGRGVRNLTLGSDYVLMLLKDLDIG